MVSRGAHAGGSGRQRVARWELRGRLALTCTVGAQKFFTAALESVDILGAPRTAQPQGLFSLTHHGWTEQSVLGQLAEVAEAMSRSVS